MQRRIFLKSSLGALPLTAIGCRRAPNGVVGLVPAETRSLRWQGVYVGALQAGRRFRASVVWNPPQDEAVVSQQICFVETMIERRLDGIVLAPADPRALVEVVETASDAGIPLTIADAEIDTDRYLSYVLTDHHKAGKLAAQALSGMLQRRGRVAVIRDSPESTVSSQREAGFAAALAESEPAVRIIVQRYCLSRRDQALAVAEEMLRAHPGLDAFFCSSEAATMGAMRALRIRRLAGKVKLVGCEANLSLQQGLREAVVDALVVRDPLYIGYTAVKTIVQKWNGLTPEKRIESPSRLITAARLSDPAIQELLNPRIDPPLRSNSFNAAAC